MEPRKRGGVCKDCGKLNLDAKAVRCWACHVFAISGRRDAIMAEQARQCVDCGATITCNARSRCRSCGYAALRRPAPSDFASMLALVGSHECAKHYGASLSTVTRWRKQIGYTHCERAPVIWKMAKGA